MNDVVSIDAELVRLREENQKQQETILQLSKELEAFSYSISHDLKAPLRAVSGFSRMLEEDYRHVLDAEGMRLLNTVSANAGRMNALIDGVLTFSRAGRKNMIVRPVNMNRLIEAAIHEVTRDADSRAKITAKDLHSISADATLMSQVLADVIGNAIKFSSKKDFPEIEISSAIVGDDVVYMVKDNGVGFDMRYADKLFSVFQRLHTIEEFDGVGVGLATVHRIISRHGGKTWIVATPGEGTTLYFSLPLSKEHPIS